MGKIPPEYIDITEEITDSENIQEDFIEINIKDNLKKKL